MDVHILENKPLEGSAVEELVAALSAYHGELLPGFYDEWVLMERQRLHGLFEARMARLMEALEAEGVGQKSWIGECVGSLWGSGRNPPTGP